MPFGASLLGRYDQEPVALRIYGLILVAIAAMRAGTSLYVTSRPHLLWQPLDDRQRRAALALTVVPGLAYLLAMLVAVVAPAVSLVIYGGMPLLYFLSITVLRRAGSGTRSMPTSPDPWQQPTNGPAASEAWGLVQRGSAVAHRLRGVNGD